MPSRHHRAFHGHSLPWVFRHFPHPKGCERRTLGPPDVTVLGFCPHTYCAGVTPQRDSCFQTRKLRHSRLQPCLLPKFKPRAMGPPAPRAPPQGTISWVIGGPPRQFQTWRACPSWGRSVCVRANLSLLLWLEGELGGPSWPHFLGSHPIQGGTWHPAPAGDAVFPLERVPPLLNVLLSRWVWVCELVGQSPGSVSALWTTLPGPRVSHGPPWGTLEHVAGHTCPCSF